ncbi:N-acetylmuramoyl-L-alanine amidase [Listeria innocua]|uniref:N-acetylmuramoyl-L-alanine amidase n=1 Tax=Listeria innocua TaxID=1642 RepID=UPI0011C8BF88|nr:N-acetylmuramoyl-L-alanine amidase [Listeria innocua]MBM5615063.1 hypothetical protein [Listeria innocua]MBM5683947.1 hypothetical protein [Listeria innocua]TXJ80135.1 hypothetical protein FP564_12750 [Listeria innocua]HBN5116509.1 N-acetylmuramoyl-L-alanine amidase [Listeria innocua]HBN5117083.1 N-acetylmuramoyl-L-alanine amidase [Listeria innocua]
MNLKKLIFKENECYKAGRKIKPKGIMVHSTGANNPYLRRYVGPDDGILGENQYNNHWNQHRPSGRQVCVHAFIGKLKNGTIATYQTLPWDHRGWHAGGDANNSHIGFEICEDNLSDASYFNTVYEEATELCAYLCKLYDLTEKDIIGHYEGYHKKIASNHGDPRHWFSRHGKSMDTFRADVKELLMPTNERVQSFQVDDVVSIKSSASKYYPGGPTIPGWVKELHHKVTQTDFNNKPVIHAGKVCVLLGMRVDKKTKQESAGIMTWVNEDELILVDRIRDDIEEAIQPKKYYRVQVGAFSKRENAENLMKELTKAGFKCYVKYE